MRKVQIICASLCAAVTISGFQNCSEHEFTLIDPAAKGDKVAGQSVFGGGSGEIGAVGGPGRGNVSATGQSNANYGGAGGLLPAVGGAITNGIVNAAANSGTGGSPTKGSVSATNSGTSAGGSVPANNSGTSAGGTSGNTATGSVPANNNGGKGGTSTSGTGSVGSSGSSGTTTSTTTGTASTNSGTQGGTSTGSTNNGSSGTSSSGTANSGTKTESSANGTKSGVVASPEIPISYRCVTDGSGGLVVGSDVIRIKVLKSTNVLNPLARKVVCEFDSSTLRDHILTRKTFPLSLLDANCASLPDGMYSLGLTDIKNYPDGNMVFGAALILHDKTEGWKPNSSSEIAVIADWNPTKGLTQLSQIKCDDTGSPLVIHMHSDVEKAEPLVLTSPRDGVWFDLLGRNADPRPYTPKRISWHRSDQYYYIALPNARGEVRGIDQLFGDNTFGPDGRFAADGFAALAKYDGMSADGRRRLQAADGYITDADAVYSKLRLWQDLNFDGVAQTSELKSLKEAGIAVIDLNFDPNYREVDPYGNETRYKSVVQDTSGRLHLLFDIWFKYELSETPSRRGLAGERP